ncbi:hypothetical protein [Actinoplanes sp. NPDC049599]|uniref:hypothetical protein n=1 Tax=Actinoplanes sp. NPDC049599 TaxID=3363903 RepID=UPI00379FFEBB
MTLRTRKPTGQMTNPVILLEGETGAGRSWKAAELSASPKINRTFWLQLGEVTADEYGLIKTSAGQPVRYEIVEHDGTWAQIYQSVVDAKAEAHLDRRTDPRPDVFVLDTVGAVWDLLSEWAYNRAKGSKKNREALAADPNAEIDISSNYWNEATGRWRRMMTQLMTFPGIVILLSRGKETIYLENGRPVTGRGDYRVEGQKGLVSDVRVWLRMTQELGYGKAKLIKLRTVHDSVVPPKAGDSVQKLRGHGEILTDFSLEALIFERLQYDPANVMHNALVPLQAGSDAPLTDAALPLELGIQSAEDIEQLKTAWQTVVAVHGEQKITDDDRRTLRRLLDARRLSFEHDAERQRLLGRIEQAQVAPPKNPGNDPARRRMMALFGQAEMGDDRDARLAYVSNIVGHEVGSTNELTDDEVQAVCERLDSWLKQLEPTGAPA